MKLELCGGPLCGQIERYPDAMPVISLWDWQGNAVTYRRRDVGRPAAPVISAGGGRMYDYAPPVMP